MMQEEGQAVGLQQAKKRGMYSEKNIKLVCVHEAPSTIVFSPEYKKCIMLNVLNVGWSY